MPCRLGRGIGGLRRMRVSRIGQVAAASGLRLRA
jgi:hypothetical protein